MANRIGLLLPRSTDYPAMGYDILDGLKLSLKNDGYTDPEFLSENIGFGENTNINYSRAEKLLLQDNVDLLIAYCNSTNAEALYQLPVAFNKPMIILDAGMQLPHSPVSTHCYHISLQGVQACRFSGYMAGSGKRKVLMATSFYDGGYRGPWGYDRGLAEAGGSICGNYVSGYKTAEFTIDPYIGLLQHSGAGSVAACFSSYLAELFFKELNEKKSSAISVPFYCSPYMAEEQMLAKCDFPGGEFYTVVPWASSLKNNYQEEFVNTIQSERNKTANIFHLLGWEAGRIVMQADKEGFQSLAGYSYQSPRGKVVIHPQTHYTYAPMYGGKIEKEENGKCKLTITGEIPVTADEHLKVMIDIGDGVASGWKNNYLCI